MQTIHSGRGADDYFSSVAVFFLAVAVFPGGAFSSWAIPWPGCPPGGVQSVHLDQGAGDYFLVAVLPRVAVLPAAGLGGTVAEGWPPPWPGAMPVGVGFNILAAGAIHPPGRSRLVQV